MHGFHYGHGGLGDLFREWELEGEEWTHSKVEFHLVDWV
jgi:hypothetical protein